MITETLKKLIDEYENIDWEYLKREDTFQAEGSLADQEALFKDIKGVFDMVIKNRNVLAKRLPQNQYSKIESDLRIFLQMVRRIGDYTDITKRNDVVNDIKTTIFTLKTDLAPLIDYIDIEPDEQKKMLQEKLKYFDNIQKEVDSAVSEAVKKLEKGVIQDSEGKKHIAGKTFSYFFETQSNKHRDSAEGKQFIQCKTFRFCKILISPYKKEGEADQNQDIKVEGWLQIREKFNLGIFSTIIVSITVFIGTYVAVITGDLSLEQWRIFWDIRITALIIMLLTALYTGMYFATKNYNREKDLEYENMNKANIAETMLILSTNSDEDENKIVISEAAKTLFAPINKGTGKQDKDGNQSMSISLPTQLIPQKINDATNN